MSTGTHLEQMNSVSQDDTESTIDHPYDRRYIRLKPKFRFSQFKECNAVSLSLWILFILLVLVIIILLLQNNNETCVTPFSSASSEAMYTNVTLIYLRSSKSFWVFNPMRKDFRATRVDDIVIDNDFGMTSFWIDDENLRVRSLYRQYPSIKYTRRQKPKVVSADLLNKQLYEINSVTNSVVVIDMYRQINRTIMRDLKDPSDLALDSARGLIFVVEKYKQIIRSSMDGTQSKSIVRANRVSSVALDRAKKQLYYFNDYLSVHSCDYDGENDKAFTSILMQVVTSSEIIKDVLYWTTASRIGYCRLNNGSCDQFDFNNDTAQSPLLLKLSPTQFNIENPCEFNTEPCRNFCLLRESSDAEVKPGYSCSCFDSTPPNVDPRTCQFINKSEPTPSPPPPSPPLPWIGGSEFVVQQGSKLIGINLQSKERTTLLQIDKNVRTFDTFRNRTIFWLDSDKSCIRSLSSNYSTIYYPRKWQPYVLKVDWFNEKIYLIDRFAGTLNVIDFLGKEHAIVLSDLSDPCDLALDHYLRYLYIVLCNSMILQSGMHGENVHVIVKEPGLSTIAKDPVKWAIYYAAYTTIKSYDGIRSSNLTTTNTAIKSLAARSGKLLWASDVGVWSCEVSNGTCAGSLTDDAQINVAGIVSIPLMNKLRQSVCMGNNGGCQQICLVRPSDQPKCACNTGWELDVTGSCKPVVNFLLYIQGNFVRGRSLGSPGVSFVDVLYPTRIYPEALEVKSAVDFDYDARSGELYFSDDRSIFSVNVLTGDEGSQRKLLRVDDAYHLKDVALDWMTGYLYYVQRSSDRGDDHVLMVLRTTGASSSLLKKTLGSFTHEPNFPMKACPYSLLVHPSRGYLFYTAWNSKLEDVQRTSTYGRGLKEIETINFHNKYRILGLDYGNSRLYVVTDRWKSSVVNHLDLDGQKRYQFNISAPQYPTTISPHGDWLYVSNFSSVWRMDKQTGLASQQLAPRFPSTERIAGLRVVGLEVQTTYAEHPCLIDNGGCQQFCFAVPHKICDCDDRRDVINGNYCE